MNGYGKVLSNKIQYSPSITSPLSKGQVKLSLFECRSLAFKRVLGLMWLIIVCISLARIVKAVGYDKIFRIVVKVTLGLHVSSWHFTVFKHTQTSYTSLLLLNLTLELFSMSFCLHILSLSTRFQFFQHKNYSHELR